MGIRIETLSINSNWQKSSIASCRPPQDSVARAEDSVVADSVVLAEVAKAATVATIADRGMVVHPMAGRNWSRPMVRLRRRHPRTNERTMLRRDVKIVGLVTEIIVATTVLAAIDAMASVDRGKIVAVRVAQVVPEDLVDQWVVSDRGTCWRDRSSSGLTRTRTAR
jgi:hypothetical protein